MVAVKEFWPGILMLVKEICLEENGIEYFKKVKVPFVPEKQLPKIIKSARKVSIKPLVDKTLAIDDEKYFTLSNSEISGND